MESPETSVTLDQDGLRFRLPEPAGVKFSVTAFCGRGDAFLTSLADRAPKLAGEFAELRGTVGTTTVDDRLDGDVARVLPAAACAMEIDGNDDPQAPMLALFDDDARDALAPIVDGGGRGARRYATRAAVLKLSGYSPSASSPAIESAPPSSVAPKRRSKASSSSPVRPASRASDSASDRSRSREVVSRRGRRL